MAATTDRAVRRFFPWQLVTVVLFAVAALHALWASGSTWPFTTADALADTVVGRRPLPPAAATWVVVFVLATTGAAMVALTLGLPTTGGAHQRAVRALCSTVLTVSVFVLAMRGILGLITSISGIRGSTARYRLLDVFVYSPLSLWLAAGVYLRPHPAVGRTPSPAAR